MLGLKKPSVKAILLLLVLSQSALAASPLHGTWRGTLVNSKSSQDVILSFNGQGYLLYSYLNKNDEEVKTPLSYQGQIVEYMPSGGGVASVSVRYLEKTAEGLSMTLDESFQKTVDGYLNQSVTTTIFQAKVDASDLTIHQATLNEEGLSNARGLVATSLSTVNKNEMRYVGILQKIE